MLRLPFPCEGSLMAAHEFGLSFPIEAVFYTQDPVTLEFTFWDYCDLAGQFFNVETAEFFRCPHPENFDLDFTRQDFRDYNFERQ